MEYLVIAIIAVIAYLLGSVNTSIIVGKVKGTDIREHGSGNAGLTNTLRTFGKGAALIVLVGDLLKGVIAILLARVVADKYIEIRLFSLNNTLEFSTYLDNSVQLLQRFAIFKLVIEQVAGISVVLGHIFPVFYKFKGGKGVLTSAVVIFMVNWKVGLICLAIFIIIVAVTKYVSLGSLMAALTAPAIIIGSHRITWIGDIIEYLPFALILAILIIAKHHGNIKRLILGEERRISFRSKKKEEN